MGEEHICVCDSLGPQEGIRVSITLQFIPSRQGLFVEQKNVFLSLFEASGPSNPLVYMCFIACFVVARIGLQTYLVCTLNFQAISTASGFVFKIGP